MVFMFLCCLKIFINVFDFLYVKANSFLKKSLFLVFKVIFIRDSKLIITGKCVATPSLLCESTFSTWC